MSEMAEVMIEDEPKPVVDTDRQVAIRKLGKEAERHVKTHTVEWLEIQARLNDSYVSSYLREPERCDVCFAYGTALKALREVEGE
ncbi:MAG: hypothetical protein ACYDD0_00870 [Candidatus Dormibacteria bacterium]